MAHKTLRFCPFLQSIYFKTWYKNLQNALLDKFFCHHFHISSVYNETDSTNNESI